MHTDRNRIRRRAAIGSAFEIANVLAAGFLENLERALIRELPYHTLLLLLHPHSCALRALPFSLLMEDVPLHFLHRNPALTAGHEPASQMHDPPLDSHGGGLSAVLHCKLAQNIL